MTLLLAKLSIVEAPYSLLGAGVAGKNYVHERATRLRWKTEHRCLMCGEPAQYEGDEIYRGFCSHHLRHRREWQRQHRAEKRKP